MVSGGAEIIFFVKNLKKIEKFSKKWNNYFCHVYSKSDRT